MRTFRLKDFKFSDQNVKVDIARENNMERKLKHCFDYLLNTLPTNELAKDNTFDFDKIIFDEGKNYDWFILKNEKTSIILRQYNNHFTCYSYTTAREYQNKLAVFSIHDDRDKMSDDESDSFCDDPYQSLTVMLPKLIEMIEGDKVHSIWNEYSLKRPKYTEVKIAMNGRDSVSNLDLLIFACDELYSTYVCAVAETDVLEQLKGYKVGDAFGKYTIQEIRTEHKEDDDYHGCGLVISDTPKGKGKWQDVYSLVAFYYSELEYELVQRDRKVMKFLYKNHPNVIAEIVADEAKEPKPFRWMSIYNDYTDIMYKLFTESEEMEEIDFFRSIDKEFRDFINLSYRITQD